MRWRPISAGVLSDKGFAPKDTQRCCGPMELPQSTAKVGPDPPWWGVGVHWTGAVLLWEASTAYDLFARKDRRGRGTKLRQGPGQLGGIGMPPGLSPSSKQPRRHLARGRRGLPFAGEPVCISYLCRGHLPTKNISN